MPLWCVQANIFVVLRFEGRSSSEMAIGEGVWPTAVVRCETDGVGSSSVSDVSTFMASLGEVLTVITLPFVEG